MRTDPVHRRPAARASGNVPRTLAIAANSSRPKPSSWAYRDVSGFDGNSASIQRIAIQE
jgi:hypothetical protein